MFGARIPVPDSEPARTSGSDELIPLDVLSLSLPEPSEGWSNFLGRQAITIRPDHIGRDAISSHDAQILLHEKRALELRAVKQQQLQEQLAIERDREWRASLPRGLPWYELPDGLAPGDAMAQAAAKAHHRKSVQAELLEAEFGDAQTMVYQPYPTDEAS